MDALSLVLALVRTREGLPVAKAIMGLEQRGWIRDVDLFSELPRRVDGGTFSKRTPLFELAINMLSKETRPYLFVYERVPGPQLLPWQFNGDLDVFFKEGHFMRLESLTDDEQNAQGLRWIGR